MRHLCWWSSAVALAIAFAGRGTGAEDTTTKESPPAGRVIESRRISPKDKEGLQKALKQIPPADRQLLDEALRTEAPAPEKAPGVVRPPIVRRLTAVPAPQSHGDADLRRMVLEGVLALTSPADEEREVAERRIMALGDLGGDTLRQVFTATANRSLRDTLSSILFVMGDYRSSLPYVLRRTNNEVWGRITAKIMDLDPDERLALVEALAALPDDLSSSPQFQFLSFAVGDYRSPGKDLDSFEAWFHIPCCTAGFREILFRRRFGANEESAGAIKERLLTRELDDQIKVFYLEYLSQEVPALLDVPALTALLGSGSETLRGAVETAMLGTLAARLPATVRALLEDKRYDPIVNLIAGYDWKRTDGEQRQAFAALVRETACDAAVWRHLDEASAGKRVLALASSIAACTRASDIAAELLAGMAALMREKALSAATKKSILGSLAGVALSAGEGDKEEVRAPASLFLHEAFEHIEAPADLPVGDEQLKGWIGLISALAGYFEAHGGDRFLSWYATPSSPSRTRPSPTPRLPTRTGVTVARTVSGGSRAGEATPVFSEKLLDVVESEKGRANIAKAVLEGTALGTAASRVLVNDRRLPLDVRRQLVERETGNTLPMLPESFAVLEELFPVVEEQIARSLVAVLWPGEQKVAEYSLSDEDRENFMRLVVKDTRRGILDQMFKMKHLPRELCFDAAQGWLAHADPGVRAGAIERLGTYATREVVPRLLPLLADQESSVRSAAVRVLGSLAAVEAEGALRALRADPSSAVRAEVDKALATIKAIKDLGQAEGKPTGEATPKGE